MGLECLASLGRERLEQFADVLRAQLPTTRTALKHAVQAKIGVTASEAEELLTAIVPYLSRGIPGGALHNRVWEKLIADAETRLSEPQVSALRAQEDILRDILSIENAVAFKAAILQQRVVPHIADFESIVDLRPVFDEKHEEVLAFAPIAILQLNLHSDSCADVGSHCFQVSPSTLRTMIRTLIDAESKIKVVLASVKSSNLRVLE